MFANVVDMSMKLDSFFRDAGLFIFRLVLGFLFVMHGWQNAVTKGWGSTRDSFAAMNIPATDVAATLASWGELVTGVLLILGFLTRLSSFVLLIDMVRSGLRIRMPACGAAMVAMNTSSSWAHVHFYSS